MNLLRTYKKEMVIGIALLGLLLLFFKVPREVLLRSAARSVSLVVNTDAPFIPGLSSDTESIDYSEMQDYWFRKIEERDPEEIYKEFKEAYASVVDMELQHNLAHVIGEILYKKIGMESVHICDSIFTSGCFHNVVGLAIQEYGIETIESLGQACARGAAKHVANCPHGIGHGLLAYFGRDRLVDALEMCDELLERVVYRGCPNGVFMEYYFGTVSAYMDRVIGSDQSASASFAQLQCEDLPKAFRMYCYVMQPMVWEQELDTDYSGMALRCNEISIPEERHSCYNGIGFRVVINADFDTGRIVDFCRRIQHGGDRILCLGHAANRLFDYVAHRHNASMLCEILDTDAERLCLDVADLSIDRICGGFEEDIKKECMEFVQSG